jgi:hypothetical protein
MAVPGKMAFRRVNSLMGGIIPICFGKPQGRSIVRKMFSLNFYKEVTGTEEEKQKDSSKIRISLFLQ